MTRPATTGGPAMTVGKRAPTEADAPLSEPLNCALYSQSKSSDLYPEVAQEPMPAVRSVRSGRNCQL